MRKFTKYPSSYVQASTDTYTDSQLEQMWLDLTDVPFDETRDGRLVLAEDWEQFPAGTDREDIWYFFDDNYSKGVAYLLGFDSDVAASTCIKASIGRIGDKEVTTEYPVEIWVITDNKSRPSKFYKQIDVFSTVEEAQEYCNNNPLDDPDEYYNIKEVAYDSDGTEQYSYGVVEIATDEQLDRIYPES